jgi:hypothetical protein
VKAEEPFIETAKLSFEASYETSWAQFREIARDMVGTAPFQSAVTPSSEMMRLNASKAPL